MASTNLSIAGLWTGTGGSATWTAADAMYSGYNGSDSYYRSKLKISTTGMTIVSSSKLVIKVTTNVKSSPISMEALLTQNNTLAANDLQQNSSKEASTALSNASIARSYAYTLDSSTGKYTLLNSSNGYDQPVGTTYYLIFETDKIKQNQDYYIYFIRCHHDGSTGSGWQGARKADIVPTLEYTSYTKCGAPTSLTLTQTSNSHSLTASWSGATAGTNNTISGYNIQISTDNGSTWGSSIAVTSTSYTWTGTYNNGAKVKIRVQTKGSAGSSYYSSWKESSTLTYKKYTACGAPTTFDITPLIYETSITLTWSGATAGTNNTIVGYHLRYSYSENGTTWGDWQELVVDTGNVSSYTFTPGNNRGTYIKYAIRTLGSAGENYASSWYILNNKPTRKNSIPVISGNLYINKDEYVQGDSITFEWVPATDVDNNISKYEIWYSVFSNGVWSNYSHFCYATGTSHTAIPAQANVGEYMKFAIRAIDSFNVMSEWAYSGTLFRNPCAYIHNDTSFVKCIPYIHNGTSFVKCIPYIHNGSSWQQYSE